MPSTATTSSADARKIFAVRPNGGAAAGAGAGLVALEPGIRRVVVPVLVAVGPPLVAARVQGDPEVGLRDAGGHVPHDLAGDALVPQDRKSTRLNSSHVEISYAVFCLKKKKKKLCAPYCCNKDNHAAAIA